MYMYMQLCCTRVYVRNCAGRDIVSQATVYVQIKMYILPCINNVHYVYCLSGLPFFLSYFCHS